MTLNVYKNSDVSPSYSIALNAGETTKVNTANSIDLTAGDSYYAQLVSVGNPGAGTFVTTLAFY